MPGKEAAFSSVTTSVGCLSVCWFDFSPMRRNGNEVGLLSIVIDQFKEACASRLRRIIDNFGLDYCRHFFRRAKPLSSRLASANDVSELRIAEIVVGIGLFYRKDGHEIRTVASSNSNLLTDRAADRLQHSGVS